MTSTRGDKKENVDGHDELHVRWRNGNHVSVDCAILRPDDDAIPAKRRQQSGLRQSWVRGLCATYWRDEHMKTEKISSMAK